MLADFLEDLVCQYKERFVNARKLLLFLCVPALGDIEVHWECSPIFRKTWFAKKKDCGDPPRGVAVTGSSDR